MATTPEWYPAAAVLLVDDWEAVDWSPDGLEKALQAVSSHLLDKAAGTAAGTMGWVFLIALKVNMAMPSMMLHMCMSCRDRRRS